MKKRTKKTVLTMLRLLKRGAIFPLCGEGRFIHPHKTTCIIHIEASD
jgi:hypothetical protein